MTFGAPEAEALYEGSAQKGLINDIAMDRNSPLTTESLAL